jgi:hypothetical protein
MTIQRLWTNWNGALGKLIGQPAYGFQTIGSRAISLAPPARRNSVAKVVTQPEELSDHLKSEFAKIREEEQNILDKLIMLD